ncbi:hypothetical protein BESB_062930 [Besnoitia besnoiti]|uniref:Transmembrane protein n=1 Tax=Besnoitia besnoiti TaxID=94643 RepID=A0A2A9MHH7_BESBE|nr:hypothetical protein BESB_062930 [Besnoitia besnoiti]PFH35406.1 hypothetical protein BESB_062930 [Besnoitia besnoiti]
MWCSPSIRWISYLALTFFVVASSSLFSISSAVPQEAKPYVGTPSQRRGTEGASVQLGGVSSLDLQERESRLGTRAWLSEDEMYVAKDGAAPGDDEGEVGHHRASGPSNPNDDNKLNSSQKKEEPRSMPAGGHPFFLNKSVEDRESHINARSPHLAAEQPSDEGLYSAVEFGETTSPVKTPLAVFSAPHGRARRLELMASDGLGRLATDVSQSRQTHPLSSQGHHFSSADFSDTEGQQNTTEPVDARGEGKQGVLGDPADVVPHSSSTSSFSPHDGRAAADPVEDLPERDVSIRRSLRPKSVAKSSTKPFLLRVTVAIATGLALMLASAVCRAALEDQSGLTTEEEELRSVDSASLKVPEFSFERAVGLKSALKRAPKTPNVASKNMKTVTFKSKTASSRDDSN